MAFTLLEFYYDFDLLKSSWRQEKKNKKRDFRVLILKKKTIKRI